MLYRYLLKIGVNEIDSQDVIQDTMIMAVSYIGEIDPADNISREKAMV